MIGTYEIRCQAAKPQMPLPPMFAFKDSPSSLRIMEVPKKIGDWNITTVKVAVNYPDNTTNIYTALRNGNVWVVTFNGCSITGKVANGLEILADGIDENGDAVNGYVLGVGDIYILDRDADIEEAVSKSTMKYCDVMPETPVAGDVVVDNGALKIYDGTQWISVDIDLSEYATKSEVETTASTLDSKIDSTKTELESSIAEVASDIPTYTSELENDSGFITSANVPTKTSELTNDSDFITSAQVEPSYDVGFAGYAAKSRYSSYVYAIDTAIGMINDKGYLFGQLSANAQTNEFELNFYGNIDGKWPWTLTELFGTQYAPTIKLNWKVATIYRKRIISGTPRWIIVKNKQWMWVADGQFAITTDAAGEPDGNFYVLFYEDETHTNCINDPATDVHPITIENTVGDNVRIATIDGQEGQINCTCVSLTRPFAISTRALAYRDELPTKVSDLTNDAGYLTSVSWGDVQDKPSIPTKTSDLTNDSGFLTSVSWNDIQSKPDIPTKTSDLTNDSDFTTNATLNAGLALKQDKLSQQEDQALDSLVDERKTFVKFIDGTTATYDIYGSFNGGDWVHNASEVKFGTGVKTIGLNVFYNCTNLTKVQFPDTLEEIWFGAFDSCTGLTDIIIPDSVTYMMGGVFQECTNLKTVIIGSGVKTIEGGVFDGCTSLESVVINGRSQNQIKNMANYPWGITDTSIIHGTASDLTQQQMAALNWAVDKYYTFIQFNNPVDTKTYFWEGEINQQTMVDEGLYDPAFFKWNKHLDIVNLGQTVTRIGTRTFVDCEFSKMTIPRNVEFIGASAFNGTTGEVVFKDRTLAEVQAMTNYPWDLNTSQIKTWNAASKEWVLEQIAALRAELQGGN